MSEEEKSLWEKAKDMAGDAVDAAQEAAGDAMEAVGDAAESATDMAKDAASSAMEAAGDAAEGAMDMAVGAKDAMVGAAGAAFDKAGEMAGSAVDAVAEALVADQLRRVRTALEILDAEAYEGEVAAREGLEEQADRAVRQRGEDRVGGVPGVELHGVHEAPALVVAGPHRDVGAPRSGPGRLAERSREEQPVAVAAVPAGGVAKGSVHNQSDFAVLDGIHAVGTPLGHREQGFHLEICAPEGLSRHPCGP